MTDIIVTGFTLLILVFYSLVVLLSHLYWQVYFSKESRSWSCCCVLYWDMQWMSDTDIYKSAIKAISWSSCCWEDLRGRSNCRGSFACGVLYKLKVRRVMFLSTVKTSGLTAKARLRPSHHRLYFYNISNVQSKNPASVLKMTECSLLIRLLENKACLSFSCSFTEPSSLVDPAAHSLAVWFILCQHAWSSIL